MHARYSSGSYNVLGNSNSRLFLPCLLYLPFPLGKRNTIALFSWPSTYTLSNIPFFLSHCVSVRKLRLKSPSRLHVRMCITLDGSHGHCTLSVFRMQDCYDVGSLILFTFSIHQLSDESRVTGRAKFKGRQYSFLPACRETKSASSIPRDDIRTRTVVRILLSCRAVNVAQANPTIDGQWEQIDAVVILVCICDTHSGGGRSILQNECIHIDVENGHDLS